MTMGPRMRLWNPKRRKPRIRLNLANQTNTRRLLKRALEDWN